MTAGAAFRCPTAAFSQGPAVPVTVCRRSRALIREVSKIRVPEGAPVHRIQGRGREAPRLLSVGSFPHFFNRLQGPGPEARMIRSVSRIPWKNRSARTSRRCSRISSEPVGGWRGRDVRSRSNHDKPFLLPEASAGGNCFRGQEGRPTQGLSRTFRAAQPADEADSGRKNLQPSRPSRPIRRPDTHNLPPPEVPSGLRPRGRPRSGLWTTKGEKNG